MGNALLVYVVVVGVGAHLAVLWLALAIWAAKDDPPPTCSWL